MLRVGILILVGLIPACVTAPLPVAPPDSSEHDDSSEEIADAGTVGAGPCAPRSPGCRASADCDATRYEICLAPDASMACRRCVPSAQGCSSDADCDATDRCETYVDSCACDTELTSTRCVPRCTTDGAWRCDEGQRCSNDGRCSPIPCTAGYECPTETTCRDGTGDGHGCVRNPCGFDGDCSCGAACMMGFCYATLGTCASTVD